MDGSPSPLEILCVQFPCNKMCCNLSAGGGSCLQSIKNAMFVTYNQAKHNKRWYAVITIGSLPFVQSKS